MNLVEKLLVRGMSISTAESITGGMIASSIVNMPGASKVFKGSVVSYTKDAKCSLLNLTLDEIEKYGVYSHEIAKAMALSIMEKTSSKVAISTTGVAGPGPDENVEPGTIFYCLVVEGKIYSKHLNLSGDRNDIRRIAVTAILADLEDIIDKI
jgi:PncC family amidohydrolase